MTRSLAAVGAGEALPPHRWAEVIFSFGSWLECACGYSALSNEQRIAHEAANNKAAAAHVIAAVEAFHQAHRDCFLCSLLEGAE